MSDNPGGEHYHEFVRQGDRLVCTVCGLSVPAGNDSSDEDEPRIRSHRHEYDPEKIHARDTEYKRVDLDWVQSDYLMRETWLKALRSLHGR